MVQSSADYRVPVASGLDPVRAARHPSAMPIAMRKRPDWDTYFMDIAHTVARRSNCCRRQVAALIVSDKRIISTGYNGTPRGVKNCFEGGCPRCASDAASGADLGECLCSHAEENAIVQAAYHGIAVRDGVLYTTISPCLLCAKMIINAGLVEVVYEDEYQFDRQTRALFREAGVKCRHFRRTRNAESGTRKAQSRQRGRTR